MTIVRKNNRIEVFQTPNVNLANNFQKSHGVTTNTTKSFRRSD